MSLDEAARTLEKFHLLVNAPALFNAVATACEIDLFGYLTDNPGASADQIGDYTKLPPHQLRVLLQAVCTTGLLIKSDGVYSNSTVAQELLSDDAEDSWKHIVIGWKEIYYPAFAQMTPALRAGTNTALDLYPGDEPTLYERLSRDAPLEALFHRAMRAFTLRSLDALADRAEFAGVRRLLDIGGGDGTTSIRLAARHPQLSATVFDLPSVSRLADGHADRLPDRVGILPGNMFTDNFPSGYDAILFSHVLEIFSEDQILGMLKKAYESLPVGGKVFLYGYNVSDDETSGIFSARLGLYFNVLASGQGMAYPAPDYERWLTQTGFREVSTVQGLPYEHGLSMAVK